MSLSAKKITVVNLIVNYASTAFSIITSIVLVPLYLHYFDLTLYGAWLASGGIIGMLGLLDGGINLVMTQRLSREDKNKDNQGFSEYFFACSTITLTLSAIIPLACLCVAPFLGEIVNYHGSQISSLQHSLVFAGVATFLSFMFANVCAAFQAWGIVHYSGVVSLLMLVVGVTVTLISLFGGFGIMALPIGALARAGFGVIALTLLGIWQWEKRSIPLSFSRNKLREMADISLAVSAGRLISGFAANSEGVIISNLLDPKSVAIWAITSKALSTATGLLNPIGSSMFAPLSRFLAGASLFESWRLILKIFIHVSSVAALLLGVTVSLNGAFVSTWVGADKYGGHTLDLLTVFAFFMAQRVAMMGLILAAKGNPKLDAAIGTGGGVVQFVLLLITAKSLGIASIPASRLLVSLCVAFPIYILILPKLFHRTYWDAARTIQAGLPLVFFTCCLGVIISQCVIAFANSWPSLVMHGCISTAVCTGFTIIVSKNTRSLIIDKIDYFSKRSAKH